jgi:hypothetical protein
VSRAIQEPWEHTVYNLRLVSAANSIFASFNNSRSCKDALDMSFVLAILSDKLAPKSNFTAVNIPDLTGKVVIVTGANTGAWTSEAASIDHANIFLSGIGKETAKVLVTYVGPRFIFQLNTSV